MRSLRVSPLHAVLAALALALGAAGCGGGDSSGDADPAASLPAKSAVYVEAQLNPEGKVKTDAQALLRKLLGSDDPGKVLADLLGDEDDADGVDFERDIRPILGRRAGLAVTGVAEGEPELVLALATTDEGKAKETFEKSKDFTQKREYRGVEYRYDGDDRDAAAVIDGTVIIGDVKAFEAAIDAREDDRTLAARKELKEARERFGGDERLGFLFLDPKGLVDLVVASGGVDPQAAALLGGAIGGSGVRSVGVGLEARADAIRIEGGALGAPKQQSRGDAATALQNMPAGSLFALGIGDVGGTVEQALGQLGGAGGADALLGLLQQRTGIDLRRDLLSWMGDAGFFVRAEPGGGIGGALVVLTKNRERAARAVGLIARFAESSGVKVTPRPGGVVIPLDERGQMRLQVVTRGNRFVAAIGDGALRGALQPAQKLGDSAALKQAAAKLGEGIKPSVFADVPALVGLLERGLPAEEFREVGPYLKRLGPLAAGSKDGTFVAAIAVP